MQFFVRVEPACNQIAKRQRIVRHAVSDSVHAQVLHHIYSSSLFPSTSTNPPLVVSFHSMPMG